jgi:hypothetical protein
MRLSIAILSCACAVGIARADEQPPPSAPAGQSSSATPGTPAADAAKAPTADHASTPAADTTVLVTAEQEKKWRSQGYRPEKRGDTTMWCRREATIGSRFEDKKCWTAATLEENERNSQHYVEELQHTSNPGGK